MEISRQEHGSWLTFPIKTQCSVATHLIISNLRLENTSTGIMIIFPGHRLSLSLLHQEILSEMPWL